MNNRNTPAIERNHDLDIFRGVAMIYIVGFMHIIGYWIDPHTNNWLSLADVVMPIIFYISGASYSLSQRKSYGMYVKGRIKRIIIPLAVYMAIYILHNTINGEIAPQELPRTIVKYTYYTFADKFENLGHIWFITPYLIIALLLPIMHFVSSRINQYGAYALLLATMVGVYFYPNYILCYGITTFAGLYYLRSKPYKSIVVLLMFVAAIILCMAQGRVWNIQINKFPPTLMYLSYTSCIIILLHQPLKWLCRQVYRINFIRYIIDQYAHNGYIIYLYHVNIIQFVHFTYYTLCEKLSLQDTFVMHPLCSLTIIATTTLIAMIAVGKIVAPINDIATRICSYTWHKCTSIFATKA